MPEMLFYHLKARGLESALPPLLEKSLARGWRVVVQVGSEERADALDSLLWTYRDDSFLPHGTTRETHAGEQPVLITMDDTNPNGANVRFLVDGVAVPADAAAYERVVLLFNGDDDEELASARQHWSAAKAQTFDVTYWQQNNEGRWERKA